MILVFFQNKKKILFLNLCKYAVVNGSHTVMGEIMGGKSKPIIGIPIYDEHTNNIKWAEEKNLGILATKTNQVTKAISKIKENYEEFEENLSEFSKNFVPNGAENSAKNCCSEHSRRKEIIHYFENFTHLARGISMGERTARDDEKIRVSDEYRSIKNVGTLLWKKLSQIISA